MIALATLQTTALAGAILQATPEYPTPHAPTCSIESQTQSKLPRSTVMHVTDGIHKRCVSVLIPSNVNSKVPILFDFHGAGGNAANYGGRRDRSGQSWADLIERHGFAVVGGQRLQGWPWLLRVLREGAGRLRPHVRPGASAIPRRGRGCLQCG